MTPTGTDRVLVRNAADPQQVARGTRVEVSRETRWRTALAAVLRTPEGRAVCWAVLTRAGIYASVFDHSGSVMAFKEGRRNLGLELQTEILATDERLYELMEQEARAWQRRENHGIDAGHTPPASDNGETT